MSAPQPVNPLYLGSSKRPAQSGNPLADFWRTQVVAPEYRAENLRILRAATVFIVGVAFVRSNLSSALVPVF
ncbi:hypothetical protein BD324DRAFT_623712 [Kockovaella imperatae]|uniref:TOM core complex subunit Tom6 n=1 Tax=Kockovaella imperatae TaxID=4999 RepID=A0A1Y1UIU6_9TREE|nr:hypothetical protein BD324DRAFT_623712 [Kockovaella imperatae]ORX37899.1 hypothetical protein BD324DRAFT_623712 [Kockovaella imperatae]